MPRGENPMSTPPRRLALFLSSLGCGGAERMMLHLARGMAAAGVPLDLVVMQANGPLAAEVPSEARVVDLAAPRMRWAIPALVRYLRRERPRAMLSRVLYANLALLLAHRLARTDTRIVVTEASTLSAVMADGLADRWLAVAARRLYPRADALVAVSAGAARDLERFLGLSAGRVRVVYNPVVDARLHERAAEPCQHPWLAQPTGPVLLSVGRLSPEKDHATLLEALAIVRRVRPVRLLIFGEGNERPRLEATSPAAGTGGGGRSAGHRGESLRRDAPRIALRPVEPARGSAERLDRSLGLWLPGCFHRLSQWSGRNPDRRKPRHPGADGRSAGMARAMLAALDQPWNRAGAGSPRGGVFRRASGAAISRGAGYPVADPIRADAA